MNNFVSFFILMMYVFDNVVDGMIIFVKVCIDIIVVILIVVDLVVEGYIEFFILYNRVDWVFIRVGRIVGKFKYYV